MKRYYLLIIILTLIILLYKIIMDYLKKIDRKNGLKIDERNYSIIGTIFSPIIQNKRISRQTKMAFKDFEIDDVLWKKAFIFFEAASLCAIIISLFRNVTVFGMIIICISGMITYFMKKIYSVFIADLCYIVMLTTRLSNNYMNLILITPALILFNYIVLRDYRKYRKDKKTIKE